ncbi:MAG: phosphomannomutase/phosphoglucomutase [Deltaproteobacteria bacterium]|nr:phosphomannomutase/phosphoglucomutase [Deltaproteobacteria bacterium]
MNEHVFRAYDIRGVADRDLDDAFVTALGRAFGTVVREAGGQRVIVGRDCRPSGDRLRAALVTGIRGAGVDVLDIGVVATPILYWAVHRYDADGGVQITGSHNPAPDNGFKIMLGKGSFFGEALQALKARILAEDFASGLGAYEEKAVTDAYVADCAEHLDFGRNALRVAVDGGNGTGGPPAVALLERLGVDVIPLYIPMDGTFPNHHPDPTVPENLAALVRAVDKHKADVGIAYDGDADRIGVIDDQGRVLWGDRLMILLARAVLREHPGAAILGEVKCSHTLFADVEKHGGRALMCPVGHSIIKQRMKEERALLAGEMSGHIFFADRWFGFDDAIYVTGRLLEILSKSDKPLSALLADVPETCVTPEIRVDCPDDRKFDVVAKAVAHFGAERPVVAIDGARVDFGDGWGLIRASNTQPALVLRAEAETEDGLARIRATLEGFIREAASA